VVGQKARSSATLCHAEDINDRNFGHVIDKTDDTVRNALVFPRLSDNKILRGTIVRIYENLATDLIEFAAMHSLMVRTGPL